MIFKLVLVPQQPGELVLSPETPLSGVDFLNKAAECLRRNLDDTKQYKHQTLGSLARYEISVPQTMAVESGFFKDNSEKTLIVENNLLNKYLFYGAAISYGTSARACYPYYKDSIMLISYIDELAFLNAWKAKSYPTTLMIADLT